MIRYSTIFLVVILVSLACTADQESKIIILPVEISTIPSSIKYGEEVSFYMKFEIQKGCTTFSHFEYKNPSFNKVSINVYALIGSSNICPTIYQVDSVKIGFVPNIIGDYYLDINNGAISKTISVF